MQAPSVDVRFPVAFQPLFQPKRYKVYYGGRGSAKSWSFARALLLLGRQKKLRILCAREFQSSIDESVHKLLSIQIDKLKLHDFYTIEKMKIYGPNGTSFFFEGIAKNTQKIKSYEDIDICWVEEAQNVTEDSWDILIPTVRNDAPFGPFGEGSEIWISFNPELEGDATYKNFVTNATDDMLVRKVSWRDNTNFPEVLRKEKDKLEKKDPDKYLWVWEGNCKKILTGAVYADELRLMYAENRVTRVPWERGYPVDTFWDLGRSDMTAIWFVQRVAFQYRFVRYLEDCGKDITHFIKLLDQLPYVFGTHYLPHDAKAKVIGAKFTVEKQLRDGGKRSVKIVPKLKIANGINAARIIFSSCYFDEKACSTGLQHIAHYAFGLNPETGYRSSEPIHDEHSHAADAFRYFAVGMKPRAASDGDFESEIEEEDLPVRGKYRPRTKFNGNPQGWMR